MKENFIKRFYIYQDERFPLKILFFTTLSVILSSASILSYQVSATRMSLVFISILLYLFHIRVVDEKRDFSHDSLYHKGRPVQRGVISLKELKLTDTAGIIIFIIISIVCDVKTISVAVSVLTLTYFAGKDFFIPHIIRKKFYIYNTVNMFQLILMQYYIYVAYLDSYNINIAMFIHLLFVFCNSALLEVVRKIKLSCNETDAMDTYSGRLGFSGSLAFCFIIGLINYIMCLWLLYIVSDRLFVYLFIVIPVFILLLFSVLLHNRIKKKTTEQLLLLSAVITYIGLNLIIFYWQPLSRINL
ncbi:MAG: hypothetical protein HY738_22265 [Bacteroidia bacterium]|nr:hypothetical protein [Bacteroidia bacterium]